MYKKNLSSVDGLKISIFFILLHLPFLFFPSVNLESQFSSLADSFLTDSYYGYKNYFLNEANSIAFSFCGFIIKKIIPQSNSLVILRCFSLFGIFLLTQGLIKLSEIYSIKQNKQILYLALFNPLVWIYSMRATADFFPMALGFFAVVSALYKENIQKEIILEICLFSISVLIKYHSIIYILLYYFLSEKKHLNINFIKLLIFPIFTLLTYWYWIYSKYSFWVMPTLNLHNPNGISGYITISNIPLNFIANLTYLSMYFLPLIFFDELKKVSPSLLIFLAFFLLNCVNLIPENLGELNFGIFDHFLKFNKAFLILIFLFFPFYLKFIRIYKKEKMVKAFLLILAAVSFLRPVNRYLIFICPIFILIIYKYVKNYKFKITILAFVFINLLLTINFCLTSLASDDMFMYIQRNNLNEYTEYNDIATHVSGKYLNFYSNEYGFLRNFNSRKYSVISGYVGNAIYVSNRNFLFINKSYSLIRTKENS